MAPERQRAGGARRLPSVPGSWDTVVILALVVVIVVGGAAIDGVASPRFWRFV